MSGTDQKKKIEFSAKKKKKHKQIWSFYLVGSAVDFDLFYYYYIKKNKIKS